MRVSVLSTVICLSLVGLSTAAEVAAAIRRTTHIPQQGLGPALQTLAKDHDFQVLYRTEIVGELRTSGAFGELTAAEALTQLLSGTQLTYRYLDEKTVTIVPLSAPSSSGEKARPADEQNPLSRRGAEGEIAGARKKSFWQGFRLAQAETSSRGEGQRTAADSLASSQERIELEEVVITGSRIRHSAVEPGASPVTVITREDIDRSGGGTVAEVLRDVPQNFGSRNEGNFMKLGTSVGHGTTGIDLRGLGADNTLVLVNGRRIANSGLGPNGGGAFVNLNAIPLAAVERVEVLTDGASAIYGSDAVSGVVNIILKDEYAGSDVSVRYGNTAQSDSPERQVTFTGGLSGARLHGILTLDYFDRDALFNRDRPFSASTDLTAFGGSDLRATSAANPGTVFATAASGGLLPGINAPFAAVPAGQNGRNLTPASFAATANQRNRGNQNEFGVLIPGTERLGVSGRGSWDFTGAASLYAEAGWTKTRIESELAPAQVISALGTVPANNPFNPFGVPVNVGWLYEELPARYTSDNQSCRAVTGVHGSWALGWHWDTALSYSRDRFDAVATNQRSIPGLSAALNSSDPATALNVFGDGAGVNSPAVLASIAVDQTVSGMSDVAAFDAKMDGVLTSIAGREISQAVGIEYRKERYDSIASFPFLAAGGAQNLPSTGERNLASAFLELSIPFFGPRHSQPGLRALELQLAARTEHYSDFGDSINPKVALRWKPSESVTLRASWAEGFRAPSLFELFDQPIVFTGATIRDPKRGNETASITSISGGNEDLQPEESTTYGAGVVVDLPWISGLSVSADFFHLKQTDQIRSLSSTILFADEPIFLGTRVIRGNPSPADIAAGRPGPLLQLDQTLGNLGFVEIRGVDVGLKYKVQTPFGMFDFRANGAYVDSFEQQVNPSAPVRQLVDTVDSPIRFKGNGSLFWTLRGWEVGLSESYTQSYIDTTTSRARVIDSHYETDLQLSYTWAQPGTGSAASPFSWLGGTRLTLGVNNLFNREPPFRNIGGGFDPAQHSARMRFIYATLRKDF